MKRLLLSGLAATGFLLAAAPVSSALAGTLVIVNRTNHEFVRLYARNNNTDELSNLDFDDNPVMPGDVRTFRVHTQGDCEDWNIEVDSFPNVMTKIQSISVCGGHSWRIREDDWGNAGYR